MKRLVIEEMGRRSGMSQADAGRAIDAVFEAVDGVLTQGSNVSIPGFGTFRREMRADRVARNPRTGESVRVAAKPVTKFREPRKR